MSIDQRKINTEKKTSLKHDNWKWKEIGLGLWGGKIRKNKCIVIWAVNLIRKKF